MLCLLAAPAFALKEGDLGEEVLSLQTRLVTLGYLEGRPDGVYGASTGYAVSRLRAFAEAAGLTFSGPETEAGADLLEALAAGRVPAFSGVPQMGDTSEAVMRVQRRLRTLGYLRDKADGYYGKNTARALRVFRHFAGVSQDANADAEALAALFSDTAPKAEFPALVKGDKGDAVLRLQSRLRLLGFSTGETDGHYGDATAAGVKAFETWLKSNTFGEIDPVLRADDTAGAADPLIQSLLYRADFPVAPAPLQTGGEGQDVYRLQRRLYALLYLDAAADGGYGEDTARAVAAFQKQNGLKENGAAGEKTLARLFSQDAGEKPRPYLLRVDLSEQKLYVLQRGKNGAYEKVVSNFPCATGAPGSETPQGVYEAGVRPVKKWSQIDGLYAQYPYRLVEGLYIQSIPCAEKGGEPDRAYLTALGSAVTGGNVYLSEENARLIWTKCPRKTRVEIVP